MKLSRVWLDFDFTHPLLDGSRSQLSEDDCAEMGAAGMRYDPATHSLIIGENLHGIAWSRVIQWEALDIQLVCGDCSKTFKTAQALGSHRQFCKGKKETAA